MPPHPHWCVIHVLYRKIYLSNCTFTLSRITSSGSRFLVLAIFRPVLKKLKQKILCKSSQTGLIAS